MQVGIHDVLNALPFVTDIKGSQRGEQLKRTGVVCVPSQSSSASTWSGFGTMENNASSVVIIFLSCEYVTETQNLNMLEIKCYNKTKSTSINIYHVLIYIFCKMHDCYIAWEL